MKRDLLVKKSLDFIKPADIVIFSGKDLSGIGSEFHTPGRLYIDYINLAIPLAIGIAMSTDKRVFVFVNETELLNNFSIIYQVAASYCRNLFVIILNGNGLIADTNVPNIFNTAVSNLAVFFNIGCATFNLTDDFNKKRFKILKEFFNKSIGPMTAIMIVEKDREIHKAKKINFFNEFCTFIRDASIKTSLYDPFASGNLLFDEDIKEENNEEY